MDLLAKYGIGRFVRKKKEFLKAVHYFESKKTTLTNHYPIHVKDIRPVLKDLITRMTLDSDVKRAAGVRRKTHSLGL